ncbi:MAG: hypothetical protein ACO4CI_12050 [Phycisphaerales bacterium]
MNLGILKETVADERRVAAVPATVPLLVKAGFAVSIERGAGVPAAVREIGLLLHRERIHVGAEGDAPLCSRHLQVGDDPGAADPLPHLQTGGAELSRRAGRGPDRVEADLRIRVDRSLQGDHAVDHRVHAAIEIHAHRNHLSLRPLPRRSDARPPDSSPSARRDSLLSARRRKPLRGRRSRCSPPGIGLVSALLTPTDGREAPEEGRAWPRS